MTVMTLMDIKKYILPGLAVLVALGLASCNPDEDETLYFLNGVPEFSLPTYGVAGDTFSFTAKGVKADDGKEVNYYWYANPISTRKDTTVNYSITLTDTLCTVTVYCVAYAEGYQSSSTSHSITIVKSDRENGSISGLSFDESKDFRFVDPRDSHEYWCTTIGSKDWFKENLAYKGTGTPLDNCEATSDVFGRFYTWDEAISACPEGWHLSSLDEWADAASVISGSRPDPESRFYSVAGGFMGDLSFNGKKMWEYWPKVKITDQLGLSMLPIGYAVKQETKADFDSMYEYATFWTSDEKDGKQAFYRYLYDESPDLFMGHSDKASFAANVRCVRDHQ